MVGGAIQRAWWHCVLDDDGLLHWMSLASMRKLSAQLAHSSSAMEVFSMQHLGSSHAHAHASLACALGTPFDLMPSRAEQSCAQSSIARVARHRATARPGAAETGEPSLGAAPRPWLHPLSPIWRARSLCGGGGGGGHGRRCCRTHKRRDRVTRLSRSRGLAAHTVSRSAKRFTSESRDVRCLRAGARAGSCAALLYVS